MGLYVVKRLVEVYGGSVALRSEGGWTTVELQLAAGVGEPVRPAASRPRARRRRADEAADAVRQARPRRRRAAAAARRCTPRCGR